MDSHCFSGYFVPPFYDSLLAKLVVKSNNRLRAIERTRNALADFSVQGVDTTIPIYQTIMENRDYMKGRVYTRWVEDILLKGNG